MGLEPRIGQLRVRALAVGSMTEAKPRGTQRQVMYMAYDKVKVAWEWSWDMKFGQSRSLLLFKPR